jgi:pimeloyl-ACP methyl ester carboxylesterase
MGSAMPYWREAGDGPAVICFHSNASVSGQWRALTDRIADRYHVWAVDSYGAGRSPDWESDRTITLADEVALVTPVLERAGERFSLVGHSYGAAVALKIALLQPERVTSIVVYEPTLFSLIEADGPQPNDADGIRDTVARAAEALDLGDRDAAARVFIDYWMGPESWAKMPEDRKSAIAASIVNVRRWKYALFKEPAPLSAFAKLQTPTLYMTGSNSTKAAHGVARRLLSALPHATHVDFPALGHMGPITHPDVVNSAIESFLAEINPNKH